MPSRQSCPGASFLFTHGAGDPAQEMLTITIQIGNADNSLKQTDWARFCDRLRETIKEHTIGVHFEGGSAWDAPVQNACWVCEINPERIQPLSTAIRACREEFGQASAATTVGETDFI